MTPTCTWCEEPVEGREQHPAFRDPVHLTCGFRMAVGSAAHHLRICSCFVPGSKLEDPPGLSKREAARAAVHIWMHIDKWFGHEEMEAYLVNEAYLPGGSVQ